MCQALGPLGPDFRGQPSPRCDYSSGLCCRPQKCCRVLFSSSQVLICPISLSQVSENPMLILPGLHPRLKACPGKDLP